MDSEFAPADIARYTGRGYMPQHAFWQATQAAMEDPIRPWSVSGSVADSSATLSAEAAAVLARISGNAPLGRLVVLAAAVAWVLAAEGGGQSLLMDVPPMRGAPHAGEALPVALPLPRGTVRELLGTVRDALSAALSHQDYPVRRFALPGLAPAPVLVTEAALAEPVSEIGTHAVRATLEGGTLQISHPNGTTAARELAGRIDRALCGFADTERALGQIELLAPTELAAVEEFGRGPVLDWPTATIPELFRAAAWRHRDRIAVRDGGQSITYGNLLARVDELAAILQRDHGVGPGALVGLVPARQTEWVVGLLGIMTAGGAYLPLAADQPAERLAEIVEEAQPALLLSARTAEESSARTLTLPLSARADAPALADNRPAGGPEPDDLAYVLYTSGSTGRPKGVQIEHGGFADMIRHQIAVFEIEPEDRILQLASATFDASLSEVFMTLLAGATLVLVEETAVAEPTALLALLRREQVSVATITPAHLAALDGARLPGMRVLIMAGDAASPDAARRYAASHSVFNAYGPTETSVCATIHRVRPDTSDDNVPIGRPVAGSRVHVLDPFGRPRPAGSAGEIVVAGSGVARGYLGQDSDAFIPDPYPPAGSPVGRAYRTGDLGRFRSDGELEFLGRIDRQVKVNGYRIEPAEIERALQRHSLVREAHIVAAVGPGGRTELAAYVALRDSVELWPSIAEFHVYDELAYAAMANDERRNASYRAAFERHLPGRTVLEIGPGAQAVLSRMAVAAGARKVYAVELSPVAAKKARARLRADGLADRVEVLTGDIASVSLPEMADVCISEIVGSIGGAEGSAVLIEASRRWLRDGSAQLPARSETRMAGLSLDGLENELAFPDAAGRYVEAIFAQVGRRFDLRLCLKNLPAERIVTTAGVFEDLDYRATLSTESSHDVKLVTRVPGRLDALLVWLHLLVDADHPEEAVDILDGGASWLPVCLALNEPSPELLPGDLVEATVVRTLSANGLTPDFHIEGRFTRDGAVLGRFAVESPHAAKEFRQTSLHRAVFDPEGQPRRAAPPSERLGQHLRQLLPAWMQPSHIVVLPSLPLNTSGKVDRRALPPPVRAAASGHAETQAPRNEREAALAAAFAAVLGLPAVGIEDDFFALGGDSIRAIQVAAKLGAAGFSLGSGDILRHRTVAALQPLMRGNAAAPGPASGTFPLTPIQCWFLGLHLGRPDHFNQAVLLRSADRLDPEALAKAVDALAAHHDMLRVRYAGAASGNSAAAEILPAEPPVTLEVTEVRPEQLAQACASMQASLNLAAGPVFRAAILRLPDGDRLFFVVHHLAVDAVSWRILLDDLETAYAATRRGTTPVLPARTESFADWARVLRRESTGRDLAVDRDWWSRSELQATARLPIADGPDLAGDAVALVAAASPTVTGLLLDRVSAGDGTDVQDLLLAALAVALRGVIGPGRFPVLLEGHGREAALASLDVSRTVGWFTTFHPLGLNLDHATAPAQLKAARQAVRATPNRGACYLLFDGWSPIPAQLSVNYLGRFDGGEVPGRVFDLAAEKSGPASDPGSRRPVPVEFLASVADGRLQLGLTFNPNLTDPTTIQALLDGVLAALPALAEVAPEPGGTAEPSRFAPGRLGEAELDVLLEGWS